MLVVGAKGFAKEVLEVIMEQDDLKKLVFYDDINRNKKKLFNEFSILNTVKQVEEFFDKVDNRFTIGIGNPELRKKMYDKFSSKGGVFTSVISANITVGSFDIELKNGINILPGARISNSVCIGKGSLIYYNVVITHDCKIGAFVEIAPNVTVLGRVIIGNNCSIGANTTILPDIVIGNNVVIGAGSVITKSIPDSVMVVGVPGKIIKRIN
ncbi:acetyltransferase [Urechidicola vernalis]|uniref:Acetyltransferase n=1 Tax=Urechidicola vernalis TaxID=3075600 RepID=A0ABU2Y242_9FLAO|nr:acetyltransferase [Urechidicola sp. P050]MDT0552276.1 acetyltransferase [Urechidicola sp. P050]